MEAADRQQFDRALGKLMYATNGDRTVPTHLADTYWSVLQAFSIREVLRAMQQALGAHESHVTPATIRNLIRPTVSGERSQHPALVAEREAEEARKRAAQRSATETDHDRMLRMAQTAYARRITGGAFGALTDVFSGGAYHDPYTGEFDFEQVVNVVELPRSKDLNEHRRTWGQFWSVLAEEWASTRPPERPDIGR